MENAQIAAIFDEIADLLELKGDNQFRIRSYRNAARTVRDLSQRVEDLVPQEEKLEDLPNIGKSTAEKNLRNPGKRYLQASRRAAKEGSSRTDHAHAIAPIWTPQVHAGLQGPQDPDAGRAEESLRRTSPCDPIRFDFEKIIEACVEFKVCLEINGQPDRLDLPDTYCKQARDAGVTFTLGTDAHKLSDLGFMALAVNVARRGGLEKKDVLNTLTEKQLKAKLKRS